MTTTSITSGTYFIGKTLIIGSTGTSNSDYARVSEFHNNSSETYLGVMFSATNKKPWFSFRPLGQAFSEPIMPWTASLNVYYVYVFSFISDIQVKYNIYEYNGASTIISKGTISTYTAASAFLQNLNKFWLGRTIWGNDFYNGRYDKVALYNGDLFALSDANILSTLLTLVTSTQTNIINNSTTYTFRSLGTNFLGVVVNILNYNTTTGSTVTTSNITLNGTGSSSGGYLNITGSYIETTTPNAPTNVTASAGNTQAIIIWTASTNNGGSAITSYTVTSSPGGLTATTANGSTTTATVSGLTNGTAYTFTVLATNVAGSSAASSASNSVMSIIMHNFNSSNKSWKMYSNTLSSISGDNLTIKPYVGKNISLEVSANNAIFIKQGDVSYNLSNLITGSGLGTGTISSIVSGSDASFGNIDVSGNLNPLITNSSSLGLATKYWANAYLNNIYGETINTQHYSQRFANSLWNIIGQDISNGPPLSNNNNKIAISNEGRIVALSSSSHSDISKGRVYVYEISYNQVAYNWTRLGLSSEIIIGLSNDDQFGWDIALSSNGKVLAASSILNDTSGTNCGQVRVFELSNNNLWRQKGSAINGPRVGSESGYSISLAGNGNRIAIGAWKDSSNGTNAGAVRVYDFSAVINDWRQQGQGIFGVSGSYEGYATALSLDGLTLASGCLNVNNANNVINAGQVKTFTWSGTAWINKGIIQGPDISYLYFGRALKLSANGNAIVIGAPTSSTGSGGGGGATGWTYNAWTNDASTGLDANSSYTVAVNLGEGDIATTVNQVSFQAHALSGTNFSIGGAVASYGSPTQNISGAGVALASNFIYNANSRTITLTNLTYGATYKTSIFSIGWDTTSMRNQIFTAVNGPSITIDPNIYGQYMGIIINCTFVADYTGSQVFTINAVNSGVTFILSALANRLISSPNISPTDLSYRYNQGSAWVYGYIGGTSWTQTGQTITGISGDELGTTVSMSNDGSIIVIGGRSSADNNFRCNIQFFKNINNNWIKMGQTINGSVNNSLIAYNHALSGDGTTLLHNLGNQSSRVYGMDKILSINSNALTISGDLLISGNINPLTNVSASLGLPSKTWANAYIRDLSVSSMEISGNILLLNDISYNLGSSLRRWKNIFADDISVNKINGQVYSGSSSIVLTSVSGNIVPISNNIFKLGDVSRNWSNAYIRDISLTNVDVSGNLIPLNNSSLGLSTRMWRNAYISDISVSSIDISGNLNPLTSNNLSLGSSAKIWGNAYIRDVSASNIELSGNLNPLNTNNSSLGSSTKIWRNAYIRDVSMTNVDVSQNIIPSTSATTALGGSGTATGGTITTSGSYTIHSFTTTGTTATFRPSFSGTVEVLIVGGGGGGGPSIGGGGGGGGVIWIPATNVSADTSYSIVVGAGGASGTNGQNSTAFGAIAAGGGTSGSWDSGIGTGGGSGGGAAGNGGGLNQGGAGKVGSSLGTNSGFIYGNRGGSMLVARIDDATRGAGGGGAGPNDTGIALDTNSTIVGNTGQTGMGSGGVGFSSAILGTSYYWGGGGGGGSFTDPPRVSVGGWGGLGGGGGGANYSGLAGTGGTGGTGGLTNGSNGSVGANTSGGAGGPNTGGGGGGGSYSSGPGGTGGSGIVVIRYISSTSVNGSSLGFITRMWRNAYIRDISVSSIDVSSGIIDPLITNNSSLGLSTRNWRNAYIRDLSVSNVDLSGNLIPATTGGGGSNNGTGGTITTSSVYRIHSFTTTGTSTFTPAFSGSVEVLIVGGGGGGGPSLGGGGGGGAVIYIPSVNVTSGTGYSIVVGDGGASGTNGQNSSAFTAIAAGGGTSGPYNQGAGTAGGSGGGAAANDGTINQGGGVSNVSTLGTNSGFIYGCSGGNMLVARTGGPTRAAGGGGAGPNGTGKALDTNSNTTGDTGQTGMGSGGVGYSSAILGQTYLWAGGGGGAAWDNQVGGYGGLGGGGGGAGLSGGGLGGGSALVSGSVGVTGQGIGGAGGPNTGGGGGGGNYSGHAGGKGGSGIVIIRYLQTSASANSSLGSLLKRWKNVYVDDLSINKINGQAYSAGGGGSTVLTSVASNVVPAVTNTYSLGTTTNYWSNAYIRDLKVSNRVYQEISGDISWSAVNGYYGLTKDAYPSLNPLSSGVKAVQSWSGRVSSNEANAWYNVCWSPELGIFVAITWAGTNKVMTSPNGVTWTGRASANEANAWNNVCWSPELKIFVAVADSGSNRVMTSPDGTTWTGRVSSTNETNGWRCVCWSPELRIFAAVGDTGSNRVMTSRDGTTWTGRVSANETNGWRSICWSKELGLFVAVAPNGSNRIMTSRNGTTWTGILSTNETNEWFGVCWSPQLGLFVAVSLSGSNRVMTSPDGTAWTGRVSANEANSWSSVCWCKELGLFVAVARNGTSNRVMTSNNGINWTGRTSSNETNSWTSVCWSSELGIFAAVADGGTNRVMTSSLKGRPPTSYNLFDSTYNSIDETGKWTYSNIAATNLSVTGTFTNTSDDRIKHNEVVISNGLAVIDQLCPKFYQKTLTLLDADYRGDLSEHAWTYEAGLVAQEVLQINDLSFVVCGGDYNEPIIVNDFSGLDLSGNDLSYNNLRRVDLSGVDTSYNVIKQAYGLNYNSIFVYGLAAIKELHAKVKAQDTNTLDEQLNSLIMRLETLEQSIQTVETVETVETEPNTN